MSAMHHDTSSDLRVVGSKLKDVLEVKIPAQTFMLRCVWEGVLIKTSRSFPHQFVFLRSHRHYFMGFLICECSSCG
jgi:hypothetical protein